MDMLPSRGQKGLFRPLHPEKYRGEDVNHIVYRSSWELTMMRRFDTDASVLAWASEPLVIPWDDGKKQRRYIPDFLVRKRNRDGVVETLLIEIKPSKDSPLHSVPVKGRKSERKYIAEVITHETNKRKWESARRWAHAHQMKFIVLTEKELGVLKR